MPKDSDTQTSTGVARTVTYRGRLFVGLLVLIGALIVVAGIVVSRGGGEPAAESSTEFFDGKWHNNHRYHDSDAGRGDLPPSQYS